MPPIEKRIARKAKTIHEIKLPKRVRDKFDKGTYRNGLKKATELAGVPEWTPHELRHTMASIIDKQLGIEAAQAFLGHKTVQVTREYAGQNHDLCVQVAQQLNLLAPQQFGDAVPVLLTAGA